MNPPGTIGGNVPQDTTQRGFDIFDSIMGIYNFYNRREPWQDEVIRGNVGCNSLFINAGREKYI